MKQLQVEDWMKFSFLSNLRFNHKGDSFLLLVKKAAFKQNIYKNKLYIFKDNDFISFGSYRDSNPKWSLDDKKIAFLRIKPNKKNKSYLCTYTLKDGVVYENEIEKKVISFEWYDSSTFILMCNEQSKDRQDGVYESAEEIPFFSNESGFVAGDRVKLYKYNLNTKELKELTPDSLNIESFKVVNKEIYFIAQEVDKMEKFPHITDLYLIKRKPKKLTFSDMYIGAFDVQNDNVIFTGSDFEYGYITNQTLYLLNLKDRKIKRLINDPFVSLGNSINSDSRGSTRTLKVTKNYIYCEGTEKDRSILYKVSYSGNYEAIRKNYSFDDFDVNSDEEVIFIRNSSHKLPEVFKLDGNTEKQLSNFNNKRFSFVKPEKFKVHGRDIDAWIMKPINFDNKKKYPAILEIHGGPKTAYGEGFMFEFQLLVSMGYVVIYSNPFGSDGYGQQFADLRGKYGTVDYDDLMKVVDSAIKKFKFIDKKRLGVTGGSYGGFMTNWIIGHTNKFKAAVTQRSISNWVSMFGISDIGYFFSGDHIAKDPWDNLQDYIDKSPLTYAKNFKTPTLIIHSKQDYRCPTPEAYQLFTALRYYSVESRMVLFEDSNHDLSRKGKPKQKTHRLIEILNWFEKHLKENTK